MDANTPRISDTWLATYDSIVYTPEEYADEVQMICQQFDENAAIIEDEHGSGFAPKGYARIQIIGVQGWKQRDALRSQLWFPTPDSHWGIQWAYAVETSMQTVDVEEAATAIADWFWKEVSPITTVLPPPAWANLLYHPTMNDTKPYIERAANIIPLDPVDALLAKHGARVVSVSAPAKTPWLDDLRRAANLVYRAADSGKNGKTLLTTRLELVEGQGIIAEAARALPEYAQELALAVGEIAAARVIEDINAVKFLSHKAGYRVQMIVQQMYKSTKARVAA